MTRDWTDDVMDAVDRGEHVLITVDPESVDPTVVTVKRGAHATAVFGPNGIHLVHPDAADTPITRTRSEGKQCAVRRSSKWPERCVLGARHDGDHFFDA